MALSALGWQAVWRVLADKYRPGRGAGLHPQRHPACGRDSGHLLAAFPLIAFSLCYEEEYRDAADALLAAGIPLARADRPGFSHRHGRGPLAF